MQEWNAAGKYWPSGAGGGGGGPELAWKEESGLDRWGGAETQGGHPGRVLEAGRALRER